MPLESFFLMESIKSGKAAPLCYYHLTMDKRRRRLFRKVVVNVMWSLIVLMGLLLIMSFAKRCSFETGPEVSERFHDILPAALRKWL